MTLPPHRQHQLQSLSPRLGLSAQAAELVDWLLLDQAFTHPSLSDTHNYEQLEFVGDAVVRLAAAKVLREIYPTETVGEMSALRSIMVSDRTLAEWGESYGLERFVLAQGNVLSDTRGKTSLLADCFEALLGALYLSTNDLRLVHPWLDRHLREKAEEVRRDPARYNYKDVLQEWTQRHHKALPRYRVESLPGKFPARFEAQVWFQENCLGVGQGTSKKSAEQAAARQAYENYIAPAGQETPVTKSSST